MSKDTCDTSDVVIIDSDEEIWEYKSVPKRLKQSPDQKSDDTSSRHLRDATWIDNLERKLKTVDVAKHRTNSGNRKTKQTHKQTISKTSVKLESHGPDDKKKILSNYKKTLSQSTDDSYMCKLENKCKTRLKPVKTEMPATPTEKLSRCGNCPVCCMPFTALGYMESPFWHVDMCLNEPQLSINECPAGVVCRSNIISHYKRYCHSALSHSLSKDADTQSSSLVKPAPGTPGNVQNAKIRLNFGGDGTTQSTGNKDMSVNVTVPRGSSPRPVEINVSCMSDNSGGGSVKVNFTCSQATSTATVKPVVSPIRQLSTVRDDCYTERDAIYTARQEADSDVDSTRDISDMLLDALCDTGISDTQTISCNTQTTNNNTQAWRDRDCTRPTRRSCTLPKLTDAECSSSSINSTNKDQKAFDRRKPLTQKVRDMSPESIFHSSSDDESDSDTMNVKYREMTPQCPSDVVVDLDENPFEDVKDPYEFLNTDCDGGKNADDSSSDDSEILLMTLTQNKIIKPKHTIHSPCVINEKHRKHPAVDMDSVTTTVENRQKPDIKSQPIVVNSKENSQSATVVIKSEIKSQPCLTMERQVGETSSETSSNTDRSEAENKPIAVKRKCPKSLRLGGKEQKGTQKVPIKRKKVDNTTSNQFNVDKESLPTKESGAIQKHLSGDNNRKKDSRASKTRTKSNKQKSNRSKFVKNFTIMTDDDSDESPARLMPSGRRCCLKCAKSQKSECAANGNICTQQTECASSTTGNTSNADRTTIVNNAHKVDSTRNVDKEQRSEFTNNVNKKEVSNSTSIVDKEQKSGCATIVNVISHTVAVQAPDNNSSRDVHLGTVVDEHEHREPLVDTGAMDCDLITVSLCRNISASQFERIQCGNVVPTPQDSLETDDTCEPAEVLPGGFFPEESLRESVGNSGLGYHVYKDVDGDEMSESTNGDVIVGGLSPDKILGDSTRNICLISRDIDGTCRAPDKSAIGSTKYDTKCMPTTSQIRDVDTITTAAVTEGNNVDNDSRQPAIHVVQSESKPNNVFAMMMSRGKKIPSKGPITVGIKQSVLASKPSSKNAADILMDNRGKQNKPPAKTRPADPTTNVPDNQRAANRNCPFYKKIQGTGFTVDAFNYGEVSGCTAYFLTHFHYDHYMGLTKRFSQPIYCSKITANLVLSKIHVADRHLHVIPLDTPTVIQGTTVTFVDANHCPGSVMIVFQLTSGRTYLHTGDFRGHPSMERSPHLASLRVNTLYLDTTYCDAQYIFPPQEDVINFTVKLAVKARANNPRTLIVCGSYTIGKERIFTAIAEALDCGICVTRDKKAILDCEGDLALQGRLSLDWRKSGLHVLPMNKLNVKSLCEHLACHGRHYNSVLAFEPTGWTFSKKLISLEHIRPKVNRDRITVYGVPYSEHSSFLELRRFVQFTCPDTILPTVNNGSGTSRRRMQVFFDSWLEEARRHRNTR